MNFDLSDEQRALAATARELFAKESPPSRLRDIWNGADVGDRAWKAMAAVGLTGLTVPAEHGGLGGDAIDLALVLEEVGRAALPEPLAEHLVAGLSIEDADLLGAMASGDALVTIAEPFAPDADRARAVLVDERLYDTFESDRVASLDHGRRLFAVLPKGDGAATRATRELRTWARASVLNGVSMRLLDMTVEYARARRQFGAPIGSFQAVKHALATGHALLVAARAAAHGAAYALVTEPPASRAVGVALVEAVAAHRTINRDALQIHGGIGFTFEHDLHLWLKRGLALAHGDREARAQIADLEETT